MGMQCQLTSLYMIIRLGPTASYRICDYAVFYTTYCVASSALSLEGCWGGNLCTAYLDSPDDVEHGANRNPSMCRCRPLKIRLARVVYTSWPSVRLGRHAWQVSSQQLEHDICRNRLLEPTSPWFDLWTNEAKASRWNTTRRSRQSYSCGMTAFRL